MTLFSLLVNLLGFAVVLGLAYWLMELVGSLLPAPIRARGTTLLLIVLALVALSWLLDFLGAFGARHIPFYR